METVLLRQGYAISSMRKSYRVEGVEQDSKNAIVVANRIDFFFKSNTLCQSFMPRIL